MMYYSLSSDMLRGGIRRVINKVNHEILRWKVQRAAWNRGTRDSQESPQIIVSLTSYPKRFPMIEMCLKSLCLQSVKPNRIILWLGNDTSKKEVYSLRERYSKYGIEVRWDDEKNLRSHKKYFYAMQEFPDDIIITADDDLIYPNDWIQSLLESYKQNPQCISARRVHQITWRQDGSPESYLKWEGEVRVDKPAHNLMATTGAGALFPPRCFGKECFNINLFMRDAQTADDIWLKAMAIVNDRKVVWAKNKMPMPTTIDLHQENKLEKVNCEGGGNDVIFRQLCKYYGLSKEDFIN